jgi:hypothetical protein
MVFDIIGAVFETSISFSYISDEQMLNKTLGIFVEIPRELYFTFQDFLIDRHRVIIVEWINSCNHFVS